MLPIAWNKKLIDSGKGEASWGIAGLPIGLGILNVDSLEELDAIMAEFPLGPFGEVEILPLVDLTESLQRAKQAAQAMVIMRRRLTAVIVLALALMLNSDGMGYFTTRASFKII